MGEETHANCRSWEEVMYWTHFQFTSFSQFLRPGFDHGLAIPEKFTTNLKKMLPNTVILKGPSGSAWKVAVTRNNDVLFFSDGWYEFVSDHCLEENDCLIFKYNGESQFEVQMFEGQSMCEKASSYFIQKRGQGEGRSTCHTETVIAENSVKVTAASVEEDVGGSHPEKPIIIEFDSEPETGPLSQKTNKTTRRQTKFRKSIRTRQAVKDKGPCAQETKAKPGVDCSPASVARSMIEEEKRAQKACQLAQAAVTDHGFVVVLRSTHVSRRNFLGMPKAWIYKHVPSLENQYIMLRVGGEAWRARFYWHKDAYWGGLTSGWRTFARDNNLHESDVCVFEPEGDSKNNSIVLDVSIFRVAQEASPVPSAPSIQVGKVAAASA